ncbi:MAG TPA: hypothetical protein VI299_23530 [Polyangiales bacterium]
MRWSRSLVLLLAVLSVAKVHAQKVEPKLDQGEDDPSNSVLANTRWSMILPERDYEGGCIMGFMTFRFSPLGYFIFNNKIHGSWRIDALGTVRLRTRDGVRFMLMLQDNQLRAVQNLPFLKRGNVFQKCSNES